MDASPQSAVFSEFIGITQSTAALIERHRTSPNQTKNDILSNVLAHREPSRPASEFGDPATLDIGEGVRLLVGEKLHLYLSQQTKKARTPDAEGTVSDTAVMMDGTAYPKRHGFLNEMMQKVQARRKHVNERGEIVSLSAWRQWHVLRNNKLIALVDLKDPALAKKRGNQISDKSIEEVLGL